jgi:pimeloyl-ACP methyl ester carboxylesterase
LNINIEGIELNYIIEGSGETVLILHGWGASIASVRPIVNILSGTHRVIALDLPGFGSSGTPKEVFGSFHYADILKIFIDRLGIERLSLVGHSFGGKLSIILSARYPDLIDKLVLIDSAGLIPRRTIKYHLKVKGFKLMKLLWRLVFFWQEDPVRMERLRKKFGSDDYQNAQGIMRKILVRVVNENLKPILKDIKAPTLLIWGDKDEATPLYQAKIMEREIKDSGLVIFEGAGHFSYVDEYNRFSLVLKAFFKEDKSRKDGTDSGGI